MKIISHRGNLDGPNPSVENTTKQIKLAIKNNLDVEIDVWVLQNKIYLGHDNPKYNIPYKFLTENQNFLWIHCKNLEAISFFKERNEGFCSYNYFWHETDKVTLTSNGIPWCYPGIFVKNGITVHCNSDWHNKVNENPDILGVCTDYPLKLASK